MTSTTRFYSNATGALLVPDDLGLIYDKQSRPWSVRDIMRTKTDAATAEMFDVTPEPAIVEVPAGRRPTGPVVATPGPGGLVFSRPSEPVPAPLNGAALLSAVTAAIRVDTAERTRERLLGAIMRAGNLDEATARERYGNLLPAQKRALFDATVPVLLPDTL